MELSKRLKTIADLVTPGRIVADIGTDHAYVPIRLIKSGVIPYAFAMDIGTGPLQRAREHVMQEHLQEKICLRLSDGLAELKCGEADCLVIAGMGGALTERILTEGKEKLQGIEELILEPQSEVFRVREWISRNSFRITDEEMVEEDGKFYPVIKAEKNSIGSSWHSFDGMVSDACAFMYGPVLLRKKHPVLKRYLEKEEELCRCILGQIPECSGEGRNAERIRQLKERMERIREADECFRRTVQQAGATAAGTVRNKISSNEDNRCFTEVMIVENTVTIYVNGTPFTFPKDTTYGDVVSAFQEQLQDDVFLVQEGRSLREFHHKITDGKELRFITMTDAAGRAAYLRSLRLLMHRAIWEVSDDDTRYDVRVLFSVSDGLFCEMRDPSLLTDSFLEDVRSCMNRLISEKRPIRKRSVSTQEARKIFHDRRMYDKEQLFQYRISSTTNIYELDGYEDYFYGYMLSNTSLLKHFDLIRFDDGFILRAPMFDKNGNMKEFRPNEKLFRVQKTSFEWGEKIGLRDVGDLNDAVVSGDMSDLILTQEAYHEMQIANIAAQIAADPDKRIILIAGPSSSGKTTFSHRLSTQLSVHGLCPHPIPVDDYFVDREKTPLDENGNYNFEILEAIDVEQFNQDMLQLLEGKEVSLPTFNFRTGRREYKGKKLQMKQGDVLVIEGIHGLNAGLTYALPKDKTFRVYISALTQLSVDEHNRIPTTDGRLIRRIVRDARTRGTSAAGTIAMWPSVRRGEEEHIFPHQGEADVMFNSALIYELAVLKIYAEPLLHGIDPECDEYLEAKRLLKFLSYFVPIAPERIPMNSLLREFIGGSCFDV